MSYDDLLLTFSIAFGLVFGSYLNVVVYRLPRGVSTAYPGSRCPRCLMPIKPWHNVPVLGYLGLLGRCRDCGVGISARYPLIEMSVGLWFGFCQLRASDPIEQGAASLAGSAFLVLGLIDLDSMKVPVPIPLISALAALALQPRLLWIVSGRDPETLLTPRAEVLVGAIGAAGALLSLSYLGRLVGQPDGFAAGDAWVLGMIGALFGIRGAVFCFFVGSLSALGVLAIKLLALKRPNRPGQPIPFVTHLSLAALLLLIVGPLSAAGAGSLQGGLP
ncbi:MAG: prepilin peptidase [Acidobacteriota bacterium]